MTLPAFPTFEVPPARSFLPCPPAEGVHVVEERNADGALIQRGGFVDGLKDGLWETFAPNGGCIKRGAYRAGKAEGVYTRWYPSGNKLSEGTMTDGLAAGTWTWWHESGALWSTVQFDAKGRRDGLMLTQSEDGEVVTRGHYDRGFAVGEWLTNRGGGKQIDYRVGPEFIQGPRESWYKNGQRQHITTDELMELCDESGHPTSRIEYSPEGVILRETTWTDGTASVIEFSQGVPLPLADDTRKLKALAKKLMAARDNATVGDILMRYVNTRYQGALMHLLWSRELLGVLAQPRFREYLFESSAGLFTGASMMSFLAALKGGPKLRRSTLPKWDRGLDELVCRVFMRDPQPFLDGWSRLKGATKRGVSFVLLRFGVDIGSTRPLATALAELWAIGELDRVLWWPEADSVESDELTTLWPRLLHDGDCTLELRPLEGLIELCCNRKQWNELLKKKALALAGKEKSPKRPALRALENVIRKATQDELLVLLTGCHATPAELFQALRDWREDSAETLLTLREQADALAPNRVVCGHELLGAALECVRLIRTAGHAVEQTSLTSAQLMLVEENVQAVTRKAGAHDDLARLDSSIDFFEDATLGRQPYFSHYAGLFDGLRCLSSKQRVNLLRELGLNRGPESLAPFLFLVSGSPLVAEVIADLPKRSSAVSTRLLLGLAQLELDAIPLLSDAVDASEGSTADAYRCAQLGCLARAASAGHPLDPSFDALIGFDGALEQPGGAIFLHKIMHRLPRSRGEEIILRGLRSRNKKEVLRALPYSAHHPTESVVQEVFTQLAQFRANPPARDLRVLQNVVRSFKVLGAAHASWAEWCVQAGCRVPSLFDDILEPGARA